MRPLRSLMNELVERRLWPVALVLVLALVAVPLLLAKPAPSTEDATPAATTPADPPLAGAASSAATPPGGEPVVAVAQGAKPDAPLRGRAKNPFRQQYEQSETTTSVSSAAGSGTATGGTGTDGSGGTGTGGGGDAGGQAPSEPEPTYTYASIDVRFGHAGHRLRRIEDVPRLTPLPNASNPIVVFLGMRRDHETAVFLVSTDVHVQGLGQCVPSQRECTAIELREGEAAFFDYTTADGDVEQYELDLDRVTLHETTSEAVAQRAFARVSRAGKLLLGRGSVRSSVDGVGRRQRVPFRYVERSGVLHIAPWASRAARSGRARGATAGASLTDLAPAERE